MTAEVTGQLKTTDDVNLQFHHRMARISINAIASDGLIINSINLKNVKTTAVYNQSTDKWSSSGDVGTIMVASGGAEVSLRGIALFPQQTINDEFIVVKTNKGDATYIVNNTFEEGRDYETELAVGLQNLTATAAITGWNQAAGTKTVIETVSNDFHISSEIADEEYNGDPKTPTVSVSDGTNNLTIDTHYTIEYFNNVNAGTGAVVAIGMKGTLYEGKTSLKTFIIKKAISSMSFTTQPSVTTTYSYGKTITNPLTGWKEGDGSISYSSSNTEVATVTSSGVTSIRSDGTTTIRAILNSDGNYESKSIEYTLIVEKCPTSSLIVELGQTSYTYDNTAKTPSVTVYDGAHPLELYTDYTYSYTNNTNATTESNQPTVIVRGVGKYTGIKDDVYFTINAAPNTMTMTTNSKEMGPGDTYTLDARADWGNIIYTSSNPSIASVDAFGVVTAHNIGTISITASVESNTNYACPSMSIAITVKQTETKYTDTTKELTYTCPITAEYTIELVGGGGGNSGRAKGGYPGIVRATKQLTAGTVLYIRVGGAGTSNVTSARTGGGANGGGNAGVTSGGGGGASDVRMGGHDLANRILTAGGGGGASYQRSYGRNGGESTSGNSDTLGDGESSSSYAGGGGGQIGGRYGSFLGGAYGGSNYIDASWNSVADGVSKNRNEDGWVIINYKL